MKRSFGLLIPSFPTLAPRLMIRNGERQNLQAIYRPASVIPFYFGRGALWSAVRALGFCSTENILVPAYHCSIEIEAIHKAGVSLKFYKVGRDMLVDLEDIEARIDPHTKAIFIIHYFGFPQPLDEIKAISKKYGLYLIEDAAHALYSSYKGRFLGAHGDFGILSMRKTLPLPDGGALVIPPGHKVPSVELRSPNLISFFRMLFLMIAKHVEVTHDLLFRLTNATVCAPARFGLQKFKRASKQTSAAILNPNAMDFVPWMGSLGMSRVSRRIIGNFDSSEVVAARRRNYFALLDRLRHIGGIHICFQDLPDGVCPYFLVIAVEGRRELQNQLLQRGISTFVVGESLHRFLPNDGFEDARWLSDHILGLPIHQDLDRPHMDYIGDAVRAAFKQ